MENQNQQRHEVSIVDVKKVVYVFIILGKTRF